MIHICDVIMGGGKSSAAITYMNEHPDRRFLYVTPYLQEAQRITDACPALHFVQPSNKNPNTDFSKIKHARELIQEGRNIASTHQALLGYTDEMLEMVREQGYVLITDEVLNTIDTYKISPCDVDVLIASKLVDFDGDRFTVGELGKEYSGSFNELFSILKSKEVYRASETKQDRGTLLFWQISPSLFTAFDEAFILTYQFKAQEMYSMFRMHNIPFDYIGTQFCDDGKYRFKEDGFSMPPFMEHLSDLIHIFDNEKINSVGDEKHSLSATWFGKNPLLVDQLRKNIYNYFNNIHRKDSNKARMWGTYSADRAALGGAGYVRRFVSFNERATNAYSDRNVLAYAVNIFINPFKKRFFKNFDVEIDDDAYALSTMVQWIWRSAIRRGEEIWIYVPSKRMRELLISWIASVEDDYRAHSKEVIECTSEMTAPDAIGEISASSPAPVTIIPRSRTRLRLNALKMQ